MSFFLAEVKRFELLRRFKPTYRISSADPSTTWVHLRILKIGCPICKLRFAFREKCQHSAFPPAILGRVRSVSIMAQIRFACKSDLLLFPARKAPRGGKGPAFAYIFPLFLFFSAFLYKIYGVFRKFKVTTAFKSCIIEEKFSQAPKLQK